MTYRHIFPLLALTVMTGLVSVPALAADGNMMSNSMAPAKPDAKTGAAMHTKSMVKKGAMMGDAMKGSAMKGDAMKGSAMKGDAMKGDAMMASPPKP